MYEFKYLLSDQDYLAFNRYHHFNAPVSKKRVQITRWMFPILAVMIVLYIHVRYQDLLMTGVQLACFTIASIIWMLLVKHLDMWWINRAIKSMKKHGKLPYGQDVLLRFEEDFFIETTADSETKTKYSTIERIVADENAIYIYIGVIQAFILPLSVFESQEQKDGFWHFIHTKAAAEKTQNTFKNKE